MHDATGLPQSILVMGGSSDIAGALVEGLAERRLERAVLAGRDLDAMERRAAELTERGVSVEVVPYDALDPAAHARVLSDATSGGDIDVVLVAFGVLGDPFDPSDDSTTSALTRIDFGAAVEAVHAAAGALERQGHGSLVVLSSVAGQRVRPENAVYGACKAGLDGFTTALADALHGSAVHVMVVRPGFVRSKMTTARPAAPFSVDPEDVAERIIDGLRRRRSVVWVPPVLRYAFAVLRALPAPLWRRLVS